jgi:hypothetical protein
LLIAGNFAELNREATKLLEVMEERRIDACKLRSAQAFVA